MNFKIVVMIAALLTTACASAPDYREASRSGTQGYSSQIIEKDRYRVNYTGDTDQSAAQVQNLALLRAAELTMENGGDWFEIVNDETSKDVDIDQRLATRGYRTRPNVVRQCGLLGCTTRAYPVTVLEEELATTERVAFDHTIEIVVHEGTKPADNLRAYNAVETAANLRKTLN